jgi:dihydroorotase
VGSAPRHDLPRTISKLIAAGMSQADALAAATVRPARALGLAGEVGTLAVGSAADLALLRWNRDAAPLADVAGAERPGACLEPVLTVRAGEVIRPDDAPVELGAIGPRQ